MQENQKSKMLMIFSALVIVLIFTIQVVDARPTLSPPDGGPTSGLAPLTVGSDPQTKAGDLTVSGVLSANEICLGGNCQVSWSSGGGVQAVNATYAIYDTPCMGWSPINGPYYYNGVLNTSNHYYCGKKSFSVTMPSGVPVGSNVVLQTPQVWCHSLGYLAYYLNNPAVYPPDTYVSDTYFLYRLAATNVSVSQSGLDAVVTGDCEYYSNYYQQTDVGVRVNLTSLYTTP